MEKINLEASLYVFKRLNPNSYEKPFEISSYRLDEMDSWAGQYALVFTKNVNISFNDIDVTADAIRSLEEQAEKIMVEARARVKGIHDRIENLRCLTHQE